MWTEYLQMLQLEDKTIRRRLSAKGVKEDLRKTWKEILRKDTKHLELTEDMAQNQVQWRFTILTADPS